MLKDEYEGLSVMGNLNQVNVPIGADAAMTWAVRQEYALRSERYDQARRGIVGTFRQLRAILVGLDEVNE